MKRNLKLLGLLLAIVVSLTGCVKYNSTMTINKDKSMDYSIIYAMNETMLEGNSLLTDENKKVLEKAGFKIEDYSDDSMKGFTISKHINNIDMVSGKSGVNYDLSGVLNNKTSGVKIFSVKKGFLKNTYTANFKFDSSDSNLDTSKLSDTSNAAETDSVNSTKTESSETYDTTEEVENLDDEDEESDDSDDTDSYDDSEDEESDDDGLGAPTDENKNTESLDSLSEMSKGMDLSFNVNLPYSAKSSNATKKENGNKKLTWNLANSQESQSIQFSFELYNMTNVYIIIGGGALLIVILVIGMVVVIKSKKKKSTVANNTIVNNPPVNNENIANPTTNTTGQGNLNETMNFFNQPETNNNLQNNNSGVSEEVVSSNETSASSNDNIGETLFDAPPVNDTNSIQESSVEPDNDVSTPEQSLTSVDNTSTDSSLSNNLDFSEAVPETNQENNLTNTSETNTGINDVINNNN